MNIELAAVMDHKSAERNDRFRGSKAVVYSGPHYGRRHTIEHINSISGLVTVRHGGDRFAVPYVDVLLIDANGKA